MTGAIAPLAHQGGGSHRAIGLVLHDDSVVWKAKDLRADGDFVDAGGNVLATVSYPDGNPSVNVAQFARDAISPFVNVG